MSTQLVTTPNVISPTPEEQERSRTIDRCLVLVQSVKLEIVTNAEQYEQAGQFMIALKSRIKEVEDICGPFKDLYHKKHAEACKVEGSAVVPATAKHVFLDSIRRAWKKEEDRKTLAEQDRINRELRAQHEAEQKRLADEQQLQAAIDAEQAGHKELADKIISQPTVLPPIQFQQVILQSTVPKTKGLSSVTRWKARLVGATEEQAKKGITSAPNVRPSFESLVLAVAEDIKKPLDQRRGLLATLDLNVSALNGFGKISESQLNIPGCEAYDAEGTSTRTS